MKEKIFKLLDGFSTPVMRNGERLVYWKIPMKQLSRKLADYLIANGVTIPVRCKDCRLWLRNGGFTKSPTGHCFCHDIETTAHDFCSYGERSNDGNL